MNSKLLVSLLLLVPIHTMASVSMFDRIEDLHVGIDGYHIGQHLSKDQQAKAKQHLLAAKVKDTYKFQDKETFVVADKKTHRVVLLYKSFKHLQQKKVKELISRSIGTFEEPTTVAHSKAIYWLYKENGTKVSLHDFQTWRSSSSSSDTMHSTYKSAKELLLNPGKKLKSADELGHILSVKLSFSQSFDQQDPMASIDAYLIISSERLIKSHYNLF